MKIAVFSTKSYDKEFLNEANKEYAFELVFFEAHLNSVTASLAKGYDAVCVFVNDDLDKETIKILAEAKVKLIVLRCAGFNNVDLAECKKHNILVARVPSYSPHGVAEHAVALILALNRKICRAYNRVHDGNFSIEGLLGFELYGKTIGVMGTGKIGLIFAGIMQGFGCKILAYDIFTNPKAHEMGIGYVTKEELFAQSDIISLHLPLTPETHYIINEQALEKMKKGVMIINTSRGGLIQSSCLIDGLKTGKIGYVGLDVYEEEDAFFFQDLSGQVIQDDVFARILTLPNVIVTSHQAFFTQTALENISQITLKNASDFQKGKIETINLVESK